MPLSFAPECCDAQNYAAIGAACAENLKDCWHALRPSGAVLYFSLPYRLGLRGEWVIVLNALLALASAALGFRALTELSSGTTRLSRIALAVASLLAHAAFMAGTIQNSLSDGPSSAVAMMSMWTLVLAMKRERRGLYVAAGAALGIAAILRAFYLYPALLAGACLLVGSVFRSRSRLSSLSFCIALLIPILFQITLTHANVHSWSFIDPQSTRYGERLHFETALYGYDTLLFPPRGLPYAATECFPTSYSMGDAIRKHHFGEALCLVERRQWFYFGSYVFAGRTYLMEPSERHFSVLLLIAHAAGALGSLVWAFATRIRARGLFVPLVLLGASLGQGSLIIPESRFLMAVHVTLWMLAATALHDLVLHLLHVKVERPKDLDPAESRAGFAWIRRAFVERVQGARAAWAAFDPRSLLVPEFLYPAAAVLITLVVQGRAFGSGLQDEDFRHLFESQQLDTVTYLIRPYGNHFCAFFRLVTATLHAFFGADDAGYFVVVVVTHLLHVLLLYGIVRAVTGERLVACAAAVAWGAFPGFQGTLQWFAAYSHMLGTTALLYALWELSRAREERRAPTTWSLVRISVALFLGAGTELTGSLTATFFPLLAFAFLPRESKPLRTALLLLPCALVSTWTVVHFTERGNAMVTALFSVGPAATMFGELVTYGVASLAAGAVVSLGADDQTLLGMSYGVASAVSVLFFLPLLAIVLGRLRRGDWDERRVLLAGIGFAGFMYAAVAAGRSGLTFGRPLTWMATRDRYHYHASIGLVLALALAVSRTFPKLSLPSTPRARKLAAACAGVWLIAGFVEAQRTYLRGGGRQEWTRDWTDLADGALRLMVHRIPRDGTLYVRNDLFRPAALIYAMGASQAVLPGIGAYWIVTHGTHSVDDRDVRFVVTDLKLLKRIRARSVPEVGKMFVSPGQVLRADGEIRTLEADAPPEVARYLLESPDPAMAPNDHALANRLRRVIRDVAAFPPAPFGPPPVVAEPDPDERPLTKQELDDKAIREAILKDPKAMEELRQTFLHDAKAREELRKALVEQAEEGSE